MLSAICKVKRVVSSYYIICSVSIHNIIILCISNIQFKKDSSILYVHETCLCDHVPVFRDHLSRPLWDHLYTKTTLFFWPTCGHLIKPVCGLNALSKISGLPYCASYYSAGTYTMHGGCSADTYHAWLHGGILLHCRYMVAYYVPAQELWALYILPEWVTPISYMHKFSWFNFLYFAKLSVINP